MDQYEKNKKTQPTTGTTSAYHYQFTDEPAGQTVSNALLHTNDTSFGTTHVTWPSHRTWTEDTGITSKRDYGIQTTGTARPPKTTPSLDTGQGQDTRAAHTATDM